MTEIAGKKRKMGDRKGTTALSKTAPKWPSIKPKSNLQITTLRDFDLFTVTNSFFFFSSLINFSPISFHINPWMIQFWWFHLSWIQVRNFFSSAESKAFVETAEGIGFAHQGSLGPAKGEAYRDNDRISVNDSVLADSIWNSGLNKMFSDIRIRGKPAVGLNPNIRLYRLVLCFCSSSEIQVYCIVWW